MQIAVVAERATDRHELVAAGTRPIEVGFRRSVEITAPDGLEQLRPGLRLLRKA
jgi:hypothetical protein